MSTRPYSELLAQVEALAGASLAAAEQARVKIFANRRARKAYRECPYWPRFLRVGEERIVSEEGLLPLTETGKNTIDQIIRIHAEEPFKDNNAFEYLDYYADSTGIQITNYTPSLISTGADMIVTGSLNPDVTGTYSVTGTQSSQGSAELNVYQSTSNSNYTLTPVIQVSGSGDSAVYSYYYTLGNELSGDYWASDFITTAPYTPDLASGTFVGIGNATGTPVVTADEVYSAWTTYYAALPDTYGDGDGEENDVPDEWFDYMAQGAYADWLRSDGQTEKAMVEDQTAIELLNQQLEKVSRQNGNQVVTRVMTHANTQWR